MTTDTQPHRIPIAHSVVYAVRGVPEVPAEYTKGLTLAPTEITLTYRSASDSQLGRVHAYVKGWWMRADGERYPTEKPVGQHYYGGPEGWPAWLAEEARLHDPDASVPPAPVDRAAVLRDFLWRLEQSAGDAAAEKFLDDNPELRRMAAEDEQPETQAEEIECAHCWREIENRSTPNMGGPSRDNWVHVPGGFTVCFPQRGADSPRAEPKPAAVAQPDGEG